MKLIPHEPETLSDVIKKQSPSSRNEVHQNNPRKWTADEIETLRVTVVKAGAYIEGNWVRFGQVRDLRGIEAEALLKTDDKYNPHRQEKYGMEPAILSLGES